jgi:S-adenosylmethionine:tRNA ribosyltransferase-isomerase
MKIEEAFSYELAPSRIAQRPVIPYDQARLLIAERETKRVRESVFHSIGQLLKPSDLLVLNDTKVIPARFLGKTGTGAKLELLLVAKQAADRWLCLAKPLKRLKPGALLKLGASLKGVVKERAGEEGVIVQFESIGPLDQVLDQEGLMPVPPYIRGGKSDQQDKTDYQTFFARNPGSIAAPTASLHFTPRLLAEIESMGCRVKYLTLHVGLSSIRPLWREEQGQQEASSPGPERYVYDPELLEACRETKAQGGRVVTVGTTVVRALESMAAEERRPERLPLEAELFIRPGYTFKLVDVLITNFHQPATTHLLLVEAFIGGPGLLKLAYDYALGHEFRFLSYGDAMCIL